MMAAFVADDLLGWPTFVRPDEGLSVGCALAVCYALVTMTHPNAPPLATCAGTRYLWL